MSARKGYAFGRVNLCTYIYVNNGHEVYVMVFNC